MKIGWRITLGLGVVGISAVLSPAELGGAIANATPLIFAALAFALPKACGFFNIGAEGQMLAGGLAAAVLGVSFGKLPSFLHIVICSFGAILAGAALASLAWLLRHWADVNEVISTIMLNLIVVSFTTYLVVTALSPGGIYQSRTHYIAPTAELPLLSGMVPWSWIREGRVSIATIVCLVVVGVYAIYLHTQPALVVRAIGLSPKVTRLSGYSTQWMQFAIVTVSGGLAGLGAIHEVLGSSHTFVANFAFGIGYTGIVAALLCGDSAVGITTSAFILGLLQYEALSIQIKYNFPQEGAIILQALLVLGILFWQRGRS